MNVPHSWPTSLFVEFFRASRRDWLGIGRFFKGLLAAWCLTGIVLTDLSGQERSGQNTPVVSNAGDEQPQNATSSGSSSVFGEVSIGVAPAAFVAIEAIAGAWLRPQFTIAVIAKHRA